MKKVKILNIQFDVCNKREALVRIFDALQNRSHEPGKQIVTPNPEMLLSARKNPAFQKILNQAWLSIPDGIGILWASTIQHLPKELSPIKRWIKGASSLIKLALHHTQYKTIFPERITGVDLMNAMCAWSAEIGKSIFLLGAEPGIAEKVKIILESKYRSLQIVGVFSGSPLSHDFTLIQAMIAKTQPEILFVAYGSPAQEIWIAEHLSQLPSVKMAMGVGGAFDFLAGKRKRAPDWMQKSGLEWLFRLIQEPSRFKRIYNATVRFPITILKK